MEIDHNPNEKRPTNGIWWFVVALLLFSAFGYFTRQKPDWWALALGFAAGGVLATWAIEITGNKVPPSWRRKPPRR